MQKNKTFYALSAVLSTMALAFPVRADLSISSLASASGSPPQDLAVSWLPGAPTVIAGILLALPFGLCAFRSLRNSRRSKTQT